MSLHEGKNNYIKAKSVLYLDFINLLHRFLLIMTLLYEVNNFKIRLLKLKLIKNNKESASFSNTEVSKKYIEDIFTVDTAKNFLNFANRFSKILAGKVNLFFIHIELKPF
jgi:hypothetical protein